MESLERIRSYINNIKIKKVLWGGYDREDVYMKMNELVDVFKDYVKEELTEQEAQRAQLRHELKLQKEQAEEYKVKLQESQAIVVELHTKLNQLTAEQIETENEMAMMKNTYKKHCSDILEQYSGSLRTLSTEFTKILENISMLQQNIVELEGIESIEIPTEELVEKESFELPDLGIDIDEWLRGDE